MDLATLSQQLIDAHTKKTERLTPLIRATARQHYFEGVRDLLKVVQDAALDQEMREQLTAPSGVQPNNTAEGE